MIFIKEQLNKDDYDRLNQLSPQELFAIGKIKGFHKRYFKCIKNYKKCAVKIINNKYYLIIVIKPELTNSYVNLSDNDNSITNPENFRKFCEWADRVIKGIENEQNNNSL